jgi:hypothetical protein
MKKINVGRVLIGGLIAGLVLNIGEVMLNSVVFANEMNNDLQRLNLPRPGGDFIARAVVATFVLGFGAAFLYAVIRAQFGPGVKTAIYAGLFAWFFTILYPSVIYNGIGVIGPKPFWIGLTWELVEYTLAAIAGASLYKEAEV